jgi:methylmalonyl-CoA mutase
MTCGASSSRSLNGADFDKRLVARTADGLRITIRADALPHAQRSLPGTHPSRAEQTQADGLGWQIHSVTESDPGAANR